MTFAPVIDLVYTWVDGRDVQHSEQRTRYLRNKDVDTGAKGGNRFRSNGEIYASIRSANRFAPWIRTIWVVVADSQLQRFNRKCIGAGSQKIRLVPHSRIFKDMTEHLPTFNSHAIESHIGGIPGLAELFMYANDDMFFGAPCKWTQFFTKTGTKWVPRILFSGTQLQTTTNERTPLHIYSRVNNSLLLNRIQGHPSARYAISHQLRPLCRSIYREAWRHPLLRPALLRTSASRFRSRSDVEPVGLLLHWAYHKRRAKLSTGITSLYVSIKDHTHLGELATKLRTGRYHLYCLNDEMLKPPRHKGQQFVEFLKSALPSSGRIRTEMSVPIKKQRDVATHTSSKLTLEQLTEIKGVPESL